MLNLEQATADYYARLIAQHRPHDIQALASLPDEKAREAIAVLLAPFSPSADQVAAVSDRILAQIRHDAPPVMPERKRGRAAMFR